MQTEGSVRVSGHVIEFLLHSMPDTRASSSKNGQLSFAEGPAPIPPPEKQETKLYATLNKGSAGTTNTAAPTNKPARHSIEHFKQITREFFSNCKEDKCEVIGVMVSTSPYAESKESRIRIRFAVLAGLGVHGFAPYQSEHIGYLQMKRGARGNRFDTDIVIPYEFFEYKVFKENPDYRRKLLLWIPEEPFAQQPLERFDALRELLYATPTESSGGQGPIHISSHLKIVGPQSSGTLKNIISKANEIDMQRECLGLDLTLYSASATMSERRLLQGIKKNKNVQNILEEHGIQLVRSISGDDQLVEHLLDELALRNSDPSCSTGDYSPFFPPEKWCRSWYESKRKSKPYFGYRNHIVLLSEWDTDYGRSLPVLFHQAVAKRIHKNDEAKAKRVSENSEAKSKLTRNIDKRSPKHIHRFAYVRGLDGDLPESDKKSRADVAKREEIPSLEAVYEPAIGSNQFDYLRRLTEQIRALDERLQAHGDGQIRAFGIFGSDVYDKLLILRALRREFPKHLFFTNDLDARYLDNEHYPATRNLLVASSFGLQLSPELQFATPPFRSSYQTSTYLAAQMIAARPRKSSSDERLDQIRCVEKILQPRIFEVGRHRFYPQKTTRKVGAEAINESPCLEKIKPRYTHYRPGRVSLHPPKDPVDGWSAQKILFTILAAVTMGVLLLISSRTVRRPLQRARRFRYREILKLEKERGSGESELPFPANTRWIIALLIIAVLGVVTITGAYFVVQHLPETYALSAGVSVWPSELIRLAAAFLSAILICVTLITLIRTDYHLRRDFHLPTAPATHRPEILSRNIEDYSERFGWIRRRKWLGRLLDQVLEVKAFLNWHDVSLDHHSDTEIARRKVDRIREGYAWQKQVSKDNARCPASSTWLDYQYFANTGRRFFRAGLATLLLWLFSLIVLFSFGDILHPVRGLTAHWVSTINGLVVFAFPFSVLLFLVMDETRLVASLSRHLCHEGIRWPPKPNCKQWDDGTLVVNLDDIYNPSRLSDDIITVEFLAQRTKPTGNLIWYTIIIIIIIMLVLFSMSTRFDNYATPLNVLGLIGIIAVIAISSAVALRRSARQAKQEIINTLATGIVARKQEGASESDRAEMVIKHIEGSSHGAFRRISEDPVTQSLVWLFSIATVILSEYYAVAGL